MYAKKKKDFWHVASEKNCHPWPTPCLGFFETLRAATLAVYNHSTKTGFNFNSVNCKITHRIVRSYKITDPML